MGAEAPSLAPVSLAPVSIAVIPDELRRPLRVLGCVAVAVILLFAIGLALRPQPGGVPVPVSASSTAPQAVLLSGSSLSYLDAQRAGHDLGWQMSVFSLPGAGISRSTMAEGGTLLSTADRLLPLASGTPDVVVVQGGEADHASTPDAVRRATEQLLDHVRQSTGPKTRVVLVGPIPGGTVPASMIGVNLVLSSVAADRGVPYVDAIAQGWRAGDPAVAGRLAAELAAAVPSR